MIEFLGRLHLLLLHLPVGFLVMLGALELLAWRRKEPASATGAILAVTAPTAIVTAVCGWLLSGNGDYDPDILGWHKWFGVSVALASTGLLFAHRAGWVKIYKPALVVTLGLVAVAGHFGASLTHGSDYLTGPLGKMFHGEEPAPFQTTGPAAGGSATASKAGAGSAYVVVIQPVFNDNCVGCHGPKKSKGKLRLDSFEGLDKGGRSGAVIVPGSAALSLLCKRLALPAGHEDHMPPDGKRQPTAGEIALLRWWIDSGADAGKTVAELNPPADILKLVSARMGAAR